MINMDTMLMATMRLDLIAMAFILPPVLSLMKAVCLRMVICMILKGTTHWVMMLLDTTEMGMMPPALTRMGSTQRVFTMLRVPSLMPAE